MKLMDSVLHRWLAIPYVLHSSVTNPAAPKNTPTILFIHGIGNSGRAWDEVVERLPKNYRIITIDLLGFGKSPQPTWAKYDAKRQARAVMATYLRLGIKGQVILVGHSLGALVSVEIAKRYPILIRSLVLCSPPFYKVDEGKRRLVPRSDDVLKDMYRLAKKHPEQFVAISTVAAKLGLVNKSYNLTRDNAAAYMNALEATIINQTSLKDATRILMPVKIIYGRLDPVVVLGNLRYLTRKNPNVELQTILAGHEVQGPFVTTVVKAIIEATGSRIEGIGSNKDL